VLAHRDRPTPAPSPTVGDAERLVQLRCETSAPNSPLGQAYERIEVGAVEVDLPAALVHDRAHVADVRSYTPCVDG